MASTGTHDDAHDIDAHDVVLPIDEGVGVLISDGVHDDIPTIDASDVGEQLSEEAPDQDAGSHHSSSLVWSALLQAHTRDPSQEQDRGQQQAVGTAFKYTEDANAVGQFSSNRAELWDLEGQFPIPKDPYPSRSRNADLAVRKLPLSVQIAFRQSVLHTLMLYVFSTSATVVTSLICIQMQLAQQHAVQSTAPSIIVAASGLVVSVSLCVLYVHRFQAPVNFAAFAVLTLAEIVIIIAIGLSLDPYAVMTLPILTSCGVIMLRVLACNPVLPDHRGKLPSIEFAVGVSIAMLATVSVPLIVLLGADATRTTTSLAIAMGAVSSLSMLWFALVLEVLERTMSPNDHAAAIVFFQSDIVVAAVLIPRHYLRKLSSRLNSLPSHPMFTQSKPQAWRKFNPSTHVVPAFWPDDLTPTAAMKSFGPAPPTPLGGGHWISAKLGSTRSPDDRDTNNSSDMVDGTSDVRNINVFGSPRRRSSVSS